MANDRQVGKATPEPSIIDSDKYPPDHAPGLWDLVPENLQPGLLAYMMERRPTGGFLRAVLENDLAMTCSRASDQATKLAIPNIVLYVFNCAPGQCWGSKEKVEAWLTGHDDLL